MCIILCIITIWVWYIVFKHSLLLLFCRYSLFSCLCAFVWKTDIVDNTKWRVEVVLHRGSFVSLRNCAGNDILASHQARYTKDYNCDYIHNRNSSRPTCSWLQGMFLRIFIHWKWIWFTLSVMNKIHKTYSGCTIYWSIFVTEWIHQCQPILNI